MIPGAEARSVAAGGLDVHVWELGDGEPLVLLHGGTATADMSWSETMPVLASRYRVIAPDTRGHGRTANPDRHLSYQQLADDVVALADILELERPVVAGYSDGAQIALELGLRHPGRASALILGGAMSEPTDEYVEGLRAWGFVAPGEVDPDRLAVEFGDDLDAMRAAHVHAGVDDVAWFGFLGQIAELWLTLPRYTDDQLSAISDPTLVITGDRDDLADLAQAERLYRAIPGSELAVVPGASHGAADRAVYWALVTDFLDRLGVGT